MTPTIPSPPGWPSDAQLVSTFAETVADAIADAQADFAFDGRPVTLAEAVVDALGLDPQGYVVVRDPGDRPVYAGACVTAGRVKS